MPQKRKYGLQTILESDLSNDKHHIENRDAVVLMYKTSNLNSKMITGIIIKGF